jgi:GNAT superfamily N-acetyltransferase
MLGAAPSRRVEAVMPPISSHHDACPAASASAPEAELVRLRDGSAVTIAATTTTDESALRSFLEGLSLGARRFRFFTGAANIAFAAHLGATTDARHHGLNAHDEAGVLVGHATYVQLDETHAEVAVEVADHLHGRGLGTILIERLASSAQRRGITYFVAEVLSENRAMLDVFRDGFDGQVLSRGGSEKRVEFPTAGRLLGSQRFKPAVALRAPLSTALPRMM